LKTKMTDHSKVKAGKAANKNHKVVRMARAEVKVTAKPLPKGAGGKAQDVIGNAKVASAAMCSNVTSSLHKAVSHIAKKAAPKAGAEGKKK
jgi:hypothetical protein